MLTRAPERTLTRRGFSALPNFLSNLSSTFFQCLLHLRSHLDWKTLIVLIKTSQISVEIVKPGGTGSPSEVISAKFAPFRLKYFSSRHCLRYRPQQKEHKFFRQYDFISCTGLHISSQHDVTLPQNEATLIIVPNVFT